MDFDKNNSWLYQVYILECKHTMKYTCKLYKNYCKEVNKNGFNCEKYENVLTLMEIEPQFQMVYNKYSCLDKYFDITSNDVIFEIMQLYNQINHKSKF